MSMGESAIAWAQEQCANTPKGCRWLSQGLGITGGEGCFWTDLVRCEQDCTTPPFIAADSSTHGGWDCYLQADHWRLNTANVIGLALNAWGQLPDDDPRLYAFPAARITHVRDIWGQTLWQPTSDEANQILGFFYSAYGYLEWRPEKPRQEYESNEWPGLDVNTNDCYVLDLMFTAPDKTVLGQAAVMFSVGAW